MILNILKDISLSEYSFYLVVFDYMFFAQDLKGIQFFSNIVDFLNQIHMAKSTFTEPSHNLEVFEVKTTFVSYSFFFFLLFLYFFIRVFFFLYFYNGRFLLNKKFKL
jgi:hypothetical protein